MKKYLHKIIVLAIITILGVMTFTGCNLDSKQAELGEETEVEEQQETIAEEKQTRIIDTVKGEVEVPINPQRIIIKSYVGDLLVLGVKPIASEMNAELYDNQLSNDYTMMDSFDAESIMALEPDLIILETDSEEYDKLSRIAPTVLLNVNELNTEERIRFLGKILGKETEAENALDKLNNLALENREKLSEAGIVDKSIIVIEEHFIFGEKYGRGTDVVYNYLGFHAPKKVQERFDSGEAYLEVSMEVLAEYSGDYILRSVYDGVADLSADAVWNSIPAVKSGKVIEVDFEKFFARDIYVMSKQITYITEAILDAGN